MSKILDRTNNLENKKNESRNSSSQINFINQVPFGNKKNNESVKAANKLSEMAKLAKVSLGDVKNARETLDKFINNVTQINAPLKDLGMVKKILYNKNDLETEDSNFSLYKASFKDSNCPDSEIRKQAVCDTVYYSWQNLETICNNYPKELLNAAENLYGTLPINLLKIFIFQLYPQLDQKLK